MADRRSIADYRPSNVDILMNGAEQLTEVEQAVDALYERRDAILHAFFYRVIEESK